MPNRYVVPQKQRPSQVTQFASSVMRNLTLLRKQPLRESGRSKVAAGNGGSPGKTAKSYKSAKSGRSSRSGRTAGRADDANDDGAPSWEYTTAAPPDLLAAHEHSHRPPRAEIQDSAERGLTLDAIKSTRTLNNKNEMFFDPLNPLRPPIRCNSHSRKRLLSQTGEDAAAATIEREGDERHIGKHEVLYAAYDVANPTTYRSAHENYDEDGEEVDEDEGESEGEDSRAYQQALTAEDQDELAYFSQRIGNSDFKLARRLVIHPHGRTRAFWDTILMVLISWILVVVPLELSFKELDPHIRRTLLRFDLFVDSMFAIDIFLNFNTGIESDGKLHFSFRSIYRHYLRSWFFPDVIWTLPLYAFVEFKDPHTYSSHATLSRVAQTHTWLYTCFRCIRFLRVFELPHLQRRLEYSLLISSKISSLGSFMYVVVALSHVFSCMFAYLAFGDQEHLAIAIESNLLESDDLQTKYIASFYWSMMTMTTVGYGDITVRTNTGRLFSLAAMVVGGGIFAYGISNVVALFQQLYVDETEHRHKMDNVNTFMHSRSLPRKLRDEIRANFFHMRKATRESKQHDYEIFQQMSRTLQSNVATLFCQEMMPRKMPFLAGCNAEFIHELYLSMEVRCYLPGEDIIRQDDYGTEMYFLFVGHVQVFLSHTKVAALGPSAFFGEFGIFNPKKPRLATIQALDFCETHCIQRRELFRILVCHPFMLRTIQQLSVLRSRKALNILYESGGKSRTLLQGLASMWHQEGILALFPPGIVTAKDEFPSLQEYLPPMSTMSSPDAAGRRASVRASFINASDANAAGGGTTSRRKSVVVTNGSAELPSTAKTLNQLRGNAASSPGKSAPRRRTSIGAADNVHLMKTLASIGPQRFMNVTDQEKADGTTHELGKETASSIGPTPSSARILSVPPPPSISDERMDALMHQMNEVVKRQELLDKQLQELLAVLAYDSHGFNRFREQHQLNAAAARLVRERSQYFHCSQSISKANEG